MDGVPSSWVTVTSSMLQGSILGPILFAVFINDLPEVTSDCSSEAIYADDTKLYKNINSTSDGDCLQESLSNLNIWIHENNIKFNASKCKVLSVTRKKNPVTCNYHLGPSSLLRIQKEKYLGIIVTDNLLWNTHIQMITAKANKMLGLLKRTCSKSNQNPVETKIRRSLYVLLVKSQLCYGTEIWSPSNVSLKIKIERIQRRATRWMLRSRIGELSYKERLQTLDMLPLCYVREIQDLVFFYKALHGYVDVPGLLFVTAHVTEIEIM